MKPLERENRELRRANEILKGAAAYFKFISPSAVPAPLVLSRAGEPTDLGLP
jgi:hypothetical protein